MPPVTWVGCPRFAAVASVPYHQAMMNPTDRVSESLGSPSAVPFGPISLEREDVAIHMRTLARTVMGTALCVGAVAVVGALWVKAVDASAVFVGTWMVALGAWALTRFFGRAFGARLVSTWFGARASVNDRLFPLSYQLVLIGLALLLPLTLHLALARVVDNGAFEPWVIVSLLFVGHVHGVLAFLLARRAGARARGERGRSRASVYGVTVAMSGVPGAFVFFVPVVAVALTGLAFLPVMALADRFIAHERERRLVRSVLA
jgi:hypothetical protein